MLYGVSEFNELAETGSGGALYSLEKPRTAPKDASFLGDDDNNDRGRRSDIEMVCVCDDTLICIMFASNRGQSNNCDFLLLKLYMCSWLSNGSNLKHEMRDGRECQWDCFGIQSYVRFFTMNNEPSYACVPCARACSQSCLVLIGCSLQRTINSTPREN